MNQPFRRLSPGSIQPQQRQLSPGSIQQQPFPQSPGSAQPYRLSPGSIQPQPYLSPGSIQPQPYPYPYPQPYPPYPQPYPQPTVGGCTQRWANMQLRDGRTLDVYVTSIAEKSLGGFLPNGQQVAIDLDEITFMTC
ncbi:hypothetical protein [Ureibacillus sinduriensis]|uniref:hypothetical protein n=1 Tax=Ureibacillus sinduriensis TaxID=561440 RepID=UPI000A076138|nr:hypothetical protein [Ureibacillus sinduriensis]